jgi:hypothetical protein
MSHCVMNVTPEEYANLKLASVLLSPADFAGFMHRFYSCQYFTDYRVKVRYDVPLIPWISAGVGRFEPASEVKK